MATIIQKFGGTSLATLDLIKKAALRVKSETEAGHRVVVVVSAMAGTTNTLLGYVRDLSTTYDRAEYDAVVSSGEQVTAGLLALSLQNIGIRARSWLGWQIPIYTTASHSNANIERIETESLLKDLDKKIVAVVAGFQGLSPEGRLTTLGRGGSDTTAVALAAALNAERCDIFTDVDGVYTADPRYVTAAGKLEHIAYQEMLELAAQGAKVLQKESVELAMKHRVRLCVLSSLSEVPGTLVTGENELTAKPQHIRGLAHTLNAEKITISAIPHTASIIDDVKALFEAQHMDIDMIQQTLFLCGKYLDFSFTILETEGERAIDILRKEKNKLQFYDLLRDSHVAKISVIGSGLQTEHSSSHKLFQTLREEGIEVQAVAASDIKLSVLISANDATRAISSLHTVYQLDVKEC
ncbi:MAG: aspartate kinase [Alphaproteobacteria bacterium 41-28]|nr:MAG: aspartate kinase [Alphaproteobacteria bacterium 41-28]